jgi:hypothetical protein
MGKEGTRKEGREGDGDRRKRPYSDGWIVLTLELPLQLPGTSGILIPPHAVVLFPCGPALILAVLNASVQSFVQFWPNVV